MKRFTLLLILMLAFLLRVPFLDKYPVGFTPDEASFGYDAYSILKTGKDQWGSSFPLVLKSFGDYKSPLYSYLAVPSVAILGLNKFAVRFPNAIIGVFAVFATYLLTEKLFKNNKISTLAAIFLAVSPWHIALSRGAFEANLGSFFLPFGMYLFLKEKYFWSGVIFGLNLFTYHSAKVVTPIIFLTLALYMGKNFKKFIPAIIAFLIFFGLTLYTFTQGAGVRVSERSITNGALEAGAKAKIELIRSGVNPVLAKILHNKYQVVVARFISNYLQYFSARFLIFDGPAETTYGMVRGLGVLTYAEFIGVISLVIFFRRVQDKNLLLLLTFWLLVSPMPASLSTGVGYAANRAAVMVPSIQIMASWGLYLLYLKFKNAYFLTGVLILLGLGVFLYKYIYLSPSASAQGMLIGHLETAQDIVSKDEKHDRVSVSKSLSEPQIYIAFAAKYDPIKYQEATKAWNFEKQGVSWVDQMPEYSLGKYIFK